MDDSAAVLRCKAGDGEAFRHLVERYQSEAIGHAVAVLGNREDAMDAVQEAFLDAFRALGRFDHSRRFYPWFYTILRNRCFKLAAGRRRHEAESVDELQLLAPAPGATPEEALLLERALFALSERERELITLRHLDGLSYEELAVRLEVPVGTVMSRLYHARKNLRGKLSNHLNRFSLGGDHE